MRKFGKTDANHSAVVDALRHLGASVVSLAAVGSGCPDVLAGYAGEYTWLIEIKDGRKRPSERRLTPDQRVFHELWRGSPIRIVQSLEDVERLIQRHQPYAGSEAVRR